MKRPHARLVGLAILSTGTIGCGLFFNPTDSYSCKADWECAPGQHCVSGLCAAVDGLDAGTTGSSSEGAGSSTSTSGSSSASSSQASSSSAAASSSGASSSSGSVSATSSSGTASSAASGRSSSSAGGSGSNTGSSSSAGGMSQGSSSGSTTSGTSMASSGPPASSTAGSSSSASPSSGAGSSSGPSCEIADGGNGPGGCCSSGADCQSGDCRVDGCTCSWDGDCQETEICRAGTCLPKVNHGEPCTIKDQCPSPDVMVCAEAVDAGMRCLDRNLAFGASCLYNEECIGGFCLDPNGGSNTTCFACDPNGPPQCTSATTLKTCDGMSLSDTFCHNGCISPGPGPAHCGVLKPIIAAIPSDLVCSGTSGITFPAGPPTEAYFDTETGAITMADQTSLRGPGEEGLVGFRVVTQPVGPSIGVFTFSQLHIPEGITVKVASDGGPANALALLACGAHLVEGVIDVSGHGTPDGKSAGPGGYAGGQTPDAGNGQVRVGCTPAMAGSVVGPTYGGGGGGANGTDGLDGGGGASAGAAGLGGVTCLADGVLAGGAGGGAGGTNDSALDGGTAGGPGGGAVYLGSNESITMNKIGAAAGINAAGGGGTAVLFGQKGAGGGGAGGTIYLEAPSITIGAGVIIAANGGEGGGVPGYPQGGGDGVFGTTGDGGTCPPSGPAVTEDGGMGAGGGGGCGRIHMGAHVVTTTDAILSPGVGAPAGAYEATDIATH